MSTSTIDRTLPGTSAVIVADIDPDTDRALWLDLRRQGLGGSDAAAICGEDPYRSPFAVWLEKVAADDAEDRDNEAMFWGRRLEGVVRDVTGEREHLAIDTVPHLLAHPDFSWMLASPDGLARHLDAPSPEGVYEGKTGGYWAGQAWADNQVPAGYVLQAQHYLAVCGLEWAIYGCLIAGQQLVVRRVARDQELIDHLIDIEADFWRRVTDRTPPAPDGSKATTDLLAHLYDVTPGSVLTVDPHDVRVLLDERAAAKADEAAAAERAAAAENQLKALAGEYEVVVDPDGRTLFTWREVTSHRLDGKALKVAHPDTHAAFLKPSTSRRFHVPASSKES